MQDHQPRDGEKFRRMNVYWRVEVIEGLNSSLRSDVCNCCSQSQFAVGLSPRTGSSHSLHNRQDGREYNISLAKGREASLIHVVIRRIRPPTRVPCIRTFYFMEQLPNKGQAYGEQVGAAEDPAADVST